MALKLDTLLTDILTSLAQAIFGVFLLYSFLINSCFDSKCTFYRNTTTIITINVVAFLVFLALIVTVRSYIRKRTAK
ncbi:MAG: hypothetical protein COY81_03890 [Candidatus Pacebacteria bacterium CG_4_10_14_0_8_um_filter_43_12]|nr:MAG: hypothetical protein COY81_03890 [Candidatus Pacebacteria bacterium CG_4_10_14_0_8_um_filter_43_12]